MRKEQSASEAFNKYNIKLNLGETTPSQCNRANLRSGKGFGMCDYSVWQAPEIKSKRDLPSSSNGLGVSGIKRETDFTSADWLLRRGEH